MLVEISNVSYPGDGIKDNRVETGTEDAVLTAGFMPPFEFGNLTSPDFRTPPQESNDSYKTTETDATIIELPPMSSIDIVRTSCDCLQLQAEHLCRLRHTDPKPQIDALMPTVDTIVTSLERCFQCTKCLSDLEVLQLFSMILKLLVRRVGACCSVPGLPDIRIGQYSPRHEDQYWVYMMICIRFLSKFQTLTALFRKRLIRISTTEEHDTQDVRYLDSTARAISESVEILLKDIQNRTQSL